MEFFVVVITLFACFAIGVPIAYSLGLAAIAGAMWIGIPLEAVMLKISDGVSKVAMLTIPFFVLAGAIMAEGGMARRLVAFANVLVGFFRIRGGLSVVNVVATTFLSGISGSSVADTSAIGSVMIPQMEKNGYPRVVRDQRHHHCLGAGAAGAAQPQRRDLLACHRRHDIDHQLVHGGRRSGAASGLLADRIVPVHGISRRPSEGPGRAAARSAQDHHRRAMGPGHARHHPGRHPRWHFHRHRGGRGGVRVGVLGHDVRLPRLQVARSSDAGCIGRSRRSRW